MRKFLKHALLTAAIFSALLIFLPEAHSGPVRKNKKSAPTPGSSVKRDFFPDTFLPLFSAAGKIADTTPSAGQFDYFISNDGSDRNNGRSATSPKRYIDSIETSLRQLVLSNRYASLGLDAGSTFREQLDVGADNISVASYNLTEGRRFAKLTGMDIVRDWKARVGSPNVYEHLLKHTIKLDQPDYNYILVAEIDTVLEKVSPVAAIRYLRLAASIAACSRVAGTYYISPLKSNPALVSIHPTDGVPGSTKYRYEVTTRHVAIEGYNRNSGKYQNLLLQSSGYGYGMLAGGKNTLVRNVVFQGGGTHHMVIKSGTVDSCLFFPGPQGLKDRIAAVFYESDGTGNINKVVNSIFVDIPFCLLTHTSGASNHQKLIIDKAYAFADTTDAQRGFSALNSDSVVITNSYLEGYPTGWYGGNSKLFISNTVFRNTSQSAIEIFKTPEKNADAVINNVLIKTNGNDNNQRPDNKSAFGVRAAYAKTNVDISRMIFHAYSSWNLMNTPVVKVFSIGGVAKAHHNIYICDVNEKNYVHVHKAFNNSGIGTSNNVASDSNVFIIVRGRGFHWNVEPINNGASTIVELSRWQALTGQDKHSVIIDLRKNPLGLKAIFVDPANGNWTFTNNRQVDVIKKLGAGMDSPPLYYPSRPSQQYTNPFDTLGGFSTFDGKIDTANRSVLEWRTFNESEIRAFAIEFSTDGIQFISIDTIEAKGGGVNNSYVYTQELAEPTRYYRLRLINKDNTTQLSAVILLQAIPELTEFKLVVFPNPVNDKITILHPKAEQAMISLYAFDGHFLRSIQLQPNVSESSFDVSGFPQGTYILKWASGRKLLAAKILKVN